MSQTFHNIFTDSVKDVISQLIHVYEESNLEKFKVVRTYLDGAITIFIDFNRAINQMPKEHRQFYLENRALFDGMVSRLQNEYNHHPGISPFQVQAQLTKAVPLYSSVWNSAFRAALSLFRAGVNYQLC